MSRYLQAGEADARTQAGTLRSHPALVPLIEPSENDSTEAWLGYAMKVAERQGQGGLMAAGASMVAKEKADPSPWKGGFPPPRFDKFVKMASGYDLFPRQLDLFEKARLCD